jgi:hypothetical protein
MRPSRDETTDVRDATQLGIHSLRPTGCLRDITGGLQARNQEYRLQDPAAAARERTSLNDLLTDSLPHYMP